MKKLFFIGVSTLLGILGFVSQSYASNAFTTVITQKVLSTKKDAKDFAAGSYGLVLANEQINADYETNMSVLLFTPELYKQYDDIMQRDARTNTEQSCIDYRVFTGAQDTYNGFWLGKAAVNNDKTTIPVYLEMNDPKMPTRSPNLILSLVNTDLGWKIDDITYVDTNKSLRAQLTSCLAQGAAAPNVPTVPVSTTAPTLPTAPPVPIDSTSQGD